MKTDLEETKSQRAQLLARTNQLANEFLDGVAGRPVARRVDFEQLLTEVGGNGLRDDGDDPVEIIEQLSRLADRAACRHGRTAILRLRGRRFVPRSAGG
jgi:hypothetical protein